MITLILITILLLLIFIYIKINKKVIKENFTGLIEHISNITYPNYKITKDKIQLYKPIDNEKKIIPIKKETKFIYIIERKLLKSAYIGDFKYLFCDKNKKNYMIMNGNLKNKNEIKIFDIKDNIIGGLLYERYNNFIFYLKLFQDNVNNKNINIEFYNNFKNAKIYLDNDDKEFYLKVNKTTKKSYDIFLFKTKKIGKIEGGKIIVNEDYKTYLNSFGLAYVLFENY